MEALKACSKCKEVKPLDAFGSRGKKRPGLASCCRRCKADQRAKRRREHPEADRKIQDESRQRRMIAWIDLRKTSLDTMKECGRCGAIKTVMEFNESQPSGPCSECTAAMAREIYHADPAHRAEINKRWVAANIERCRDRANVRHAQNKDSQNAWAREWRRDNPARAKATQDRARQKQRSKPDYSRRRFVNRLAYQYGLTLTQWEEMVSQQENKCKICGCDGRDSIHGRLHIDHCHATGDVRGLLCGICNTSLGGFRDDPALLRAAADYLERHAAKLN